MNNAPEKIYLQIGADCDHNVDFNELVGVTWNKDRINKNDVEYMRADLTKWNKVEECEPVMFQENLLVKSDGRIIVCSYYGPLGFMEHKRNYIKGRVQGSEYQNIKNVTEWKPII